MTETGITSANSHPLRIDTRICRPFMVALFLVVLAASAIRIAAISLPLERDEGEFAYMAQLILDGVPPYEQAYGQKMPGIYYAYALIMLFFGQSSAAIHLGLMLVNFASALFLFFVVKELFGMPQRQSPHLHLSF